MSGRAAIIQGDAFAVLASLGDGSVDHVITDPPYTRRSTNARTSRRGAAPTGTGGDAGIAEGVGAWDRATLERFAAECVRVSRRWVIIFCELESLGTFADHPAFIRSGIWDRHSTPQMSGDRPAQPGEGIAILHRDGNPADLIARALGNYAEQTSRGDEARAVALADLIESGAAELMAPEDSTDPAALAIMHREGRKRWNGGGKRAMYRHPVARGAQRIHPAQKPGSLILELIETFTDPGDRILDPCCGVGTVPAVAAGVGRDGVGVESHPVWFRRAQLRAAGDPAWCAPLDASELAALGRSA